MDEPSKPKQQNLYNFIARSKKLGKGQIVSKIISFINQKFIKGLLSLFVVGTVVFCFGGVAKAAIIGGANAEPDKVWWFDHRDGGTTNMTGSATDTVSNDVILGSETTDAHYIGMNYKFDKIVYKIDTAGVGGTVTFKYWDGSIWATVTTVTDTTNSFTQSQAGYGTVSFTIPGGWVVGTVNEDGYKYWIKVETMGTYSTTLPKAGQISVVEYNLQLMVARMDGITGITGLTTANFTFGGGTDNEIKGFREIGSTGVYQFALKPDNYNSCTITVTGYTYGTLSIGVLNTNLTDKGTITMLGVLRFTVNKMDGTTGIAGIPVGSFTFSSAIIEFKEATGEGVGVYRIALAAGNPAYTVTVTGYTYGTGNTGAITTGETTSKSHTMLGV
ncbi:MAG: hypothetical protein ABIF11_02235, partial [Nitrospirota bacterium]